MSRTVFLMCLVATISCTGNKIKTRSPRILNGVDASAIDYPYMLFFYYSDNESEGIMCGASIISAKWALTSAHCVANIPRHQLRIHSNLTDFEFESIQVGVVKIVVHPLSVVTGNSADYDIALLKVNPAFTFGSGIQPIGLPEQDQETEPGAEGIITGWGRAMVEGQQSPSDSMQVGTVTIISQSSCVEIYSHAPRPMRGAINERMICATGDSAACKGDSGGPLVADDLLIGIVSWGSDLCNDYPTVFARVAYFRDWIRHVTGV